jgi:fatty-acyl-CoA synthase
MPLFHTAGSVVDQLSMLVSGGTVVRAMTFDAAKMLELVDREKATVLNAVPTMLIAMLHEPRFQAGEFDTSSLRCVLTAGTPIPVPLMEQVKARWGAEPAIMFGMTEASPIITQTLPEDSFELRSTTVGIPLPYTEVQITAADGTVVDVGQPGEILVRGYNVMRGYYRMPAETAAAIDADGWLHTGDVASMDERGYVRIVGRIKDMIIRGGENVYPAEVEAFLMRHPSIRQAQVVGVPDSYMGEEAVAVLQLKEGETLTEDEVRGYCRAALARHKVPRYVRFVSDYPPTPSGKVKKFELRTAMIAALGLDAATR